MPEKELIEATFEIRRDLANQMLLWVFRAKEQGIRMSESQLIRSAIDAYRDSKEYKNPDEYYRNLYETDPNELNLERKKKGFWITKEQKNWVNGISVYRKIERLTYCDKQVDIINEAIDYYLKKYPDPLNL